MPCPRTPSSSRAPDRACTFKNATFAAFGTTREPATAAAETRRSRALLDSGAGVITLVAKSRHPARGARAAHHARREPRDDRARRSRFLREQGRRVFLDAEHFFDGYRFEPAYAVAVVRVAVEAGADVVRLCDTNGGMLPEEVAGSSATSSTAHRRPARHPCHNDSGCAVANSMAAVAAGVTHVQGTVNGYGERTGNADLLAMVANLELKRGHGCSRPAELAESTRIAHAIAEITNMPPSTRQPYVGVSAFAHKAGLHASAIKVDPGSLPAH